MTVETEHFFFAYTGTKMHAVYFREEKRYSKHYQVKT